MPNIKKTTFNVEPDRSENADIFQFFKTAWGKTSSEKSKELKNIKHKKRLHVKTLKNRSFGSTPVHIPAQSHYGVRFDRQVWLKKKYKNKGFKAQHTESDKLQSIWGNKCNYLFFSLMTDTGISCDLINEVFLFLCFQYFVWIGFVYYGKTSTCRLD